MRKLVPSKLFYTLLFSFINVTTGFTQIPDWSSQVAPIIYNHCSTCHHDGGIAPFPLMSYDDAVNNAWTIQADVNARKMPPWPADPSYNHFRDEKILTETEINTISDWVNGNTPAGNLAMAPPPPVFTGNTLMTAIDDTIEATVYTVEGDLDEFRTFVIHSNYTETKYLNQVEFIPGNAAVVHHVFLLQDTSDYSYQKDLDDPDPGYRGGGFGDFGPSAELLCGWIPGSDMISLPSNMGFVVPPGADFLLSFHYAPGSEGKTDSTKVNLHFCNVPDVRPVTNDRWLSWFDNSLLNPPFEIPANQVKTFYNHSAVFEEDKSIIAIQPHMHLIGKSYKVFMVTAPGDTTNLIYIPNWDFQWQLNYFFTKIIKVPVGAEIFGCAVYDNTINNPSNPSNPPQLVKAGESTFDEMMGCRFSILDYVEGDENILLDSSFYTPGQESFDGQMLSLQLFPNPANDKLHFVAELPVHEVDWKLMNQMGTVIEEVHATNIPNGIYNDELGVTNFSAGIYYLFISSGGKWEVKKVVIAHEK